MNENIKAGAISLGIILFVSALTFILGSMLPQVSQGESIFTRIIPFLTVVNVLLIMILLYTYAKAYMKMNSGFTLGILLFISCLLMFVVVSNHTLLRMLNFDKGSVFMDMVAMLFATISLAILLYISNK